MPISDEEQDTLAGIAAGGPVREYVFAVNPLVS
jgi:hypothetical protein